MSPCAYCEGVPRRVWFDKESRVWCVECPCDIHEFHLAQTEQEARYLWDNGDQDGWEDSVRGSVQATLF